MEDWKREIIDGDLEFSDKQRGIIKGIVPKSLSFDFHKKMPKGAALRELEKKHLHLSYWETPYYNEAITSFIGDMHRENTIIADIGCGDGRLTSLLLDLGFTKIVAIDIDLTPLMSLADYLKDTGNSDKVLLIQSGIESTPVKDGVCDAVLAIGVLYYLNEKFQIGLKEAHRLLREDGVLINSEPDKEGAIYKSLIFESLSDVLENYFNDTFKEEKGETPFKFRLFSEGEILSLFSENGFKCLDKYGLSLFPSLVRIMMVRGQILPEELSAKEREIRTVMDFMNGSGKLNKHIIWKSIKSNK